MTASQENEQRSDSLSTIDPTQPHVSCLSVSCLLPVSLPFCEFSIQKATSSLLLSNGAHQNTTTDCSILFLDFSYLFYVNIHNIRLEFFIINSREHKKRIRIYKHIYNWQYVVFIKKTHTAAHHRKCFNKIPSISSYHTVSWSYMITALMKVIHSITIKKHIKQPQANGWIFSDFTKKHFLILL